MVIGARYRSELKKLEPSQYSEEMEKLINERAMIHEEIKPISDKADLILSDNADIDISDQEMETLEKGIKKLADINRKVEIFHKFIKRSM